MLFMLVFLSSEIVLLRMKVELAESFSGAVHNSIVVGDFRSATNMLKTLSGNFSQIDICPDRLDCFNVFESNNLDFSFMKKIKVSDSISHKILFSVPLGTSFFAALLIIAVISIVLVPILIRNDNLKIEKENMKLDLEVKDQLFYLSARLAHDLQSPLVLLSQIVDELQDTEIGIMTAKVCNRLQEISSGVLRDKKIVDEKDLFSVVKAIFIEKQLEYSQAHFVNFEIKFKGESFYLNKLNSSDLKRIISNLINNAIEARRLDTLLIQIVVDANKKIISIEDNGLGIPKNFLNLIGTKGITIGKKDGNGLGVSSAREIINSIGGKFEIKSKEGEFTKVIFSVL